MTSGSRDSERQERCDECEKGYERYPHDCPVTASDGAGLDREEWGVRDDHFGNVDPMDDRETAIRVAASDTRNGVPSRVVRRTTTPWVVTDRG